MTAAALYVIDSLRGFAEGPDQAWTDRRPCKTHSAPFPKPIDALANPVPALGVGWSSHMNERQLLGSDGRRLRGKVRFVAPTAPI